MLRAALGVRRMNPKALESEDHLMNRGCGDLEVFQEVAFSRGPAVELQGMLGGRQQAVKPLTLHR